MVMHKERYVGSTRALVNFVNVYDENRAPLSGIAIRLDVMTATRPARRWQPERTWWSCERMGRD